MKAWGLLIELHGTNVEKGAKMIWESNFLFTFAFKIYMFRMLSRYMKIKGDSRF